MKLTPILLGALTVALLSGSALAATTLTIATVNNGDMIRMQKLTGDFTKKNPDIQLQWVTLEENVLRQKVTTDITTKGGQYDIVTIGNYEVPIWAKNNWLLPLDNLGADFDADDLLRGAAGHPELEPLAQALAAQWHGLTPGFHRLAFEGGRVLLTLCVGDIAAMLREQAFRADSVFLDGFSPERNPQMWSPDVLKAMARLCHRGTTLATWTVAGQVRRPCSRADTSIIAV